MLNIKRSWPLLSLCLLIVINLNCSCNEVKLCCNEGKGDFTDDVRSYCLDHATAVRLFIQKLPDRADQEQRLESFEQFFEDVKDCTTLECIETAINSTAIVPEFKAFYDPEHADAQNDLTVDEDKKPGLVLCGFEHAIATGIPE